MLIFEWYFWMFIILFLIFLVWLFNGGKKHEFIGMYPLAPEYNPKTEPDVPEVIEKSLKSAEEEFDTEIEVIKSHNDIDLGEEKKSFKQKSRGEIISKKCVERWFKDRFLTAHPDFLKNPLTGKNLELDCFNPGYRLAIEYNGVQHYEFPNRYHKTEEEFLAYRARDEFKRRQCNEHGVHLIVIPYTVKLTEIPDFIRSRLPVHYRGIAKADISDIFED